MKSLLKSVMTGLMGNFRNSLKVHTSTSFITGGLEDNLLFKKLSSFQLFIIILINIIYILHKYVHVFLL